MNPQTRSPFQRPQGGLRQAEAEREGAEMPLMLRPPKHQRDSSRPPAPSIAADALDAAHVGADGLRHQHRSVWLLAVLQDRDQDARDG